MTFLYTARYSIVLLRPKNKVKLTTQSAEKPICVGNGLYHVVRFYFSGFRKAPDVQIFQGLRLLPMWSLKKVEQESFTGAYSKGAALQL